MDYLDCEHYIKASIKGYCNYQKQCKIKCYYSINHIKECIKKLEEQIKDKDED